MSIAIAVDAMGGDFGPRVTVPASLAVLRENPLLRLTLVGDESQISPFLSSLTPSERERVCLVHTQEVVAMDDRVAVALRQKKRSSMRLAINLVQDKSVDACVSAGNTGALMAVSRFVLRTHADIDRPAIMAALPTSKGHVHVLDLGANVDSGPRHLLQFAQMGSIVAEVLDGIEKPRVGLLNIGEEEIKGGELIKQADELLKRSGLNYIGYVEGDGIFKGYADVVVCDGFVGNVALKASEGVAKMLAGMIRAEVERSWLTRVTGLLAFPIWKGLRHRMDPGRYNGASLVGLTGIVIKSHGGADEQAFVQAVRVAVKEVEKDVPALIHARMGASVAP
ncbi:MAG: phosphate acyltransferase PlsX [Pseudomonadota bacterium]